MSKSSKSTGAKSPGAGIRGCRQARMFSARPRSYGPPALGQFQKQSSEQQASQQCLGGLLPFSRCCCGCEGTSSASISAPSLDLRRRRVPIFPYLRSPINCGSGSSTVSLGTRPICAPTRGIFILSYAFLTHDALQRSSAVGCTFESMIVHAVNQIGSHL
jgi:hypothetical protein